VFRRNSGQGKKRGKSFSVQASYRNINPLSGGTLENTFWHLGESAQLSLIEKEKKGAGRQCEVPAKENAASTVHSSPPHLGLEFKNSIAALS
jgi:hypothetical protein